MTIGELAVLAAVPGVVDVAGVTGCELVQLVLVGQLGIAATCTGVEGEYTLASWFPDAQRLLDLTVATLEAGGAVVDYETAGIVVSGDGSETGAVGATLDRRELPEGAEFVEGVGAVGLPGADGFVDRRRTLVGGSVDQAQIIRAPVEDVRQIVELGLLDVRVAEVRDGAAVRGSVQDIETIRSLVTGEDWLSYALPGIAGDRETADTLEAMHGVDVELIGGRAVINGYRDDVLAAVSTVNGLGLHRQGRSVDVAFVFASLDDIEDAGVEVEASLTGADYLVLAGSPTRPGLSVVLRQLRSSGNIKIEERPSLAVLDGKPSEIRVGRDIPVRVASDEDGESFEFRSTGTILTVLTEPATGGLVRVTIDIEVSGVDGEGVGGNPIVASRNYRATVELERGVPATVAALKSSFASVQRRNRLLIPAGGASQASESLLNVIVQIR